MSRESMRFSQGRGSPGVSPELRRAALLGAMLLVAASWSAGRLAAEVPARPGQVEGYSTPGRQPQLLLRRPGPTGRG
jgi:hypothetical protein